MYLKDGDKGPEKTVKVLAFTDSRVADRAVGHSLAELTAEQIHAENTAASNIQPRSATNMFTRIPTS